MGTVSVVARSRQIEMFAPGAWTTRGWHEAVSDPVLRLQVAVSKPATALTPKGGGQPVDPSHARVKVASGRKGPAPPAWEAPARAQLSGRSSNLRGQSLRRRSPRPPSR